MKLLTTYAALDLLGPAFTWSTPVWLAGQRATDGVLEGNLVMKGSGDPKLDARAPLAAVAAAARRWACARSAATSCSTSSAFAVPEVSTRPSSTASRCGPTTRGRDALLLNLQVRCCSRSRPTRRAAWRGSSADPPLAGCGSTPAVPLGRRPLRRLARRAEGRRRRPGCACALPAAIPLACGERSGRWPMPIRGSYTARLLSSAVARARRARSAAACATARRRTARAELRAQLAAAGRRGARHQQVQQQRDGAAALPDARRCSARAARGTPEAAREVLRAVAARSARRVRCGRRGRSTTARACRATRALSAGAAGALLQARVGSPVMPELMASLPVTGIDGTLRRSPSRRAGQGAPEDRLAARRGRRRRLRARRQRQALRAGGDRQPPERQRRQAGARRAGAMGHR